MLSQKFSEFTYGGKIGHISSQPEKKVPDPFEGVLSRMIHEVRLFI